MHISATEAVILAAATAPIWVLVIKELKNFLLWLLDIIKNLIITEVQLDGDLGKMVMAYMPSRYSAIKFPTPKSYAEGRHFVRPLGQFMSVLFRNREYNDALFKIGRWPLMLSGKRSVTASNQNIQFPFKMRYLVGTVDHEKILRDAQTAYDSIAFQGGGRFSIQRLFGSLRDDECVPETGFKNEAKVPTARFHAMSELQPVGFEPDELGVPQSKVALSRLFLTPEVCDLVEEVRFWYAAKDWYEERGVPWRRGYLLHGPPGTGKTSLGRALAEELDIPLYAIDLASHDNGELIKNWTKIGRNTPAIVLIEDIDAVFHGRENVANKRGVTFDCLLQCLDGAAVSSGILTFITTNNIDKIDFALSAEEDKDGEEIIPTRPGRIDRRILIKGLDEEGRFKLALRILKDEQKAREVAAEGAADTPAQLQERAFRRATDELFEHCRKGWRPPAKPPEKGTPDEEQENKVLNYYQEQKIDFEKIIRDHDAMDHDPADDYDPADYEPETGDPE